MAAWKMLGLFVAFAGFSGCGMGTNVTASTPTDTSQSALACSDQPRINADGTATSIGCAFEQQWENVTHHGTKLAAPTELVAGGNSTAVQVSYRCGDWLMGEDGSGVTIFVNSVDGTVRSHGALHPGFPVSALGQALTLPITEK